MSSNVKKGGNFNFTLTHLNFSIEELIFNMLSQLHNIRKNKILMCIVHAALLYKVVCSTMYSTSKESIQAGYRHSFEGVEGQFFSDL